MRKIKIEKKLMRITSMFYSFAFCTAKAIFGVVTGSYFFLISAFYTLCFGFAKLTYLIGVKKSNGNNEVARKFYTLIALLIISGSFSYLLYAIRLFYVNDIFRFSLEIGIAIAAISFTELIIAMKNLFKRHSILSSASKLINLSTSLFAIYFTQVVIMSFTGGGNASYASAIGGLVFSCVVICIGVYMIIKSLLYKRHFEKNALNS